MTKKRILFYSDHPDWAYDHIAKAVADDLKGEFEFYFDYCLCHLFRSNKIGFFDKLWRDAHRTFKNLRGLIISKGKWDWDYDFFDYRMTPFWVKNVQFKGEIYNRKVLPPWKSYDVIIYMGFYFEHYAKLSSKGKKLIKGIYTESFPPEGIGLDFITGDINNENLKKISIESFVSKFFDGINLMACGSINIFETYKNHFENRLFLNYLINEDSYKLHPSEEKESLVVGWSGNPDREFKNYYSIIEPVVKRLQAEGLKIELKTRFSGPIENLAKFYSGIDVVLIASTADAGPSLFRECSLSGIPSISTNVGFPSYVIQDNINGFFVECSISAFEEKLRELYFDRDKLLRAARKIRGDYLKKMGNRVLIENWRKAFETKN